MKKLLCLLPLLFAGLAHSQAIPPIPAGNIICNATGTVTYPAACASLPTGFALGTVSATSLTLSSVTGSTQCLHASTAGLVSGTGSDCGSGGSTAFSGLTSGTNTAMAALVGTGASLGVTGSGTIGATSAPIAGLTGAGTGVLTFLATPSSANLASAVTGETGSGALVFGTSPTFTTGATLGFVTGSTQCLHVNTSGLISGTGSDCGSGGSTAFSSLTTGSNTTATMTVGTGGTLTVSGTGVNNANQVNGATVPISAAVLASNSSGQATALTLGGNLAISSGVLSTSQAINAQTGTTYAMLSTDAGKLVTFSNASAVAVTLSVATTAGFTAGYSFDVENLGAGTVTITPTTSTINGASTLAITQGYGCTVTSDGTNYQVSACTAVGSLPVSRIAGIGAHTFLGNVTGSTASPTAVGIPYAMMTYWLATTKFTVAATGCTPSATTGTAFGGTITLAAGPCTSLVITMNGATGYTATTGFSCQVSDRTTQTAGTWIPEWGETSSTTTTATIAIPAAAGATDVISFNCQPN
ncbi:MAG: hypothetical protein RB191_12885 [Terriglobia bacterium]|nr:hypothetical protein [Terriglobia bacterium]